MPVYEVQHDTPRAHIWYRQPTQARSDAVLTLIVLAAVVTFYVTFW